MKEPGPLGGAPGARPLDPPMTGFVYDISYGLDLQVAAI